MISNTFSILVAQRTRELALLRAVGAGRAQVLGSVLLEAILVGLVSAVLGSRPACGLAKGVTAAARRRPAPTSPPRRSVRPAHDASSSRFVHRPGRHARSPPLVPAIRATRVPPLAALRDVAIDRSGASKASHRARHRRAPRWAPSTCRRRGQRRRHRCHPHGRPRRRPASSSAPSSSGPILAEPERPGDRRSGSPRLKGITGKLATENAARSPKRTSATASALIIGVALVGFITVFAASATESVDGARCERGFTGDFVVQSEGGASASRRASRRRSPTPVAARRRRRRRRARRLRRGRVHLPGRRDGHPVPHLGRARAASPRCSSPAWPRARSPTSTTTGSSSTSPRPRTTTSSIGDDDRSSRVPGGDTRRPSRCRRSATT